MKEIGGYFELDQFINKPYHNNVIELNTGRNALIYIVKAKKIKKIYLPFFLCDSVTKILDKHLVEYECYHIDKKFMPIFNKKLKDNEYLYIVNYYGQISDDEIIVLKEKYNYIIVDNTQAFFQKPISGVDTIYSCRKFLGVPDGAYLSTNAILAEELDEDKSSTRMNHILGRFEGQASDFYNDFQYNDGFFEELPLKSMSKLTRNILGAIDYEKIVESRNKNFIILHNKLSYKNILDISFSNGAFAYPYYIENGLEIKKKLAKKKIYVPTLWPNVLRENDWDSIEYNYSANILPLPCDQRYGAEEMEYLYEVLISS